MIVRFGEQYRQWNAAFDAGMAAALGKPLVTLHPEQHDHALKEVDRAALAVAREPEQVVDILQLRDAMTYVAAENRYEQMPYRRTGRSGLQLPAISLGLWHNFGDTQPLETQRAVLRRAFDLGVTHFDLANNYGPPFGSAERNFGRILREDLAPYRDELIISTKAGYDMWPGPYGEWGSRKYLLASLDQSLQRMGLDYVDIFYSHRFDPETPLEETHGRARRGRARGQGALRRHLVLLRARGRARRWRSCARSGRRCSSTSRPTRCSTAGSRRTCSTCSARPGVGSIVFSPLAQGMLTDKYLDGIPEGTRATDTDFLSEDMIEGAMEHVRALNDMAQRRDQTLAQMAIAWTLRDPRVTSSLIGARTVEQLEDSLGALRGLDFSDEELAEIDGHAVDAGINLWKASSDA